jgi:hypothetical protein
MNTYEFVTFILGFILRLAAPVSVTALGVWLLRRLDARWQSEALRQAANVGGLTIPLQNLNCWDVHDCPPERKANCPAYLNPNMPCWEAHRVNGQLQEACQNCAFHKMKRIKR